MIKFKDILSESDEVKIPNNIKKLIDQANALIDQSGGRGIEPDGTWESVYEFKPITVKGKFVYIEYSEPYSNNKKTKDRHNISDYDSVEVLRWVIRAVKKGIKKGDY